MEVLVDYDNLERATTRMGVDYVVDRILGTLAREVLTQSERIRIRLYGGWYENKALTHRAQKITAEIHRIGAGLKLLQLPDDTVVGCPIQVELALSLEIEPSRHLWYTYRCRSYPEDLRCHSPGDVGCQSQQCPLDIIKSFLDSRRCPEPNCNIAPADILYRGQQKLVDAMLAADIFHIAFFKKERFCVVSSDEDFWPSIRSALLLGIPVVHVHAKPGWRTRKHYCAGAGAGYLQMSL